MLSILICTYNRCDILQETLESCILHNKNQYPLELIVIDNNATDATYDVVHQLKEKHPWISYVLEKRVGLSYARNTGYKAARYDWVLYLDDDALIHRDFFERLNYLIHNTAYPFVGGLHLPWYKYGKPKWFRDNYVSNKRKSTDLTVFKNNEYATGCIMLIKKTLLESHGGFNPKFGMNGTKVAYGEETDFQQRVRLSGTEVAYDPSLIIYHLVPRYKMSVRWFLRSSYEMGKTFLEVNGYVHNKLTGLLSLGIATIQCVLHFLISLPKLLRKGYCKENFMLDVFKKPLKWYGVFVSSWH